MNKSELKKLLADDKPARVIQYLLEISRQLNDTELSNTITLQSARYQGAHRDFTSGILTNSEYAQRKAQINHALFYIIEQLPDREFTVSEVSLPEPPAPPPPGAPPTPEPGDSKKYGLPAIIALAVALLTFWGSYERGIFNSESGNLARFMVLAITGLAAAFALFGLLRSSALFTGKVWGGTLEVGGPAVLFLAIMILGNNISSNQAAFDLMVEVQPPEGHLVYLANYGVVTLDLPTGPMDKTIDRDGRAFFSGLSPQIAGKKIKIRFKQTNQPYRPQFPDSLYLLQPASKVIHLPVVLDHLDVLEGFVEEDTPPYKRIPGATVRIRQTSTETGANGLFHLNIPPAIQAKYQTVEVTKAGYETWRRDSIPIHTRQELPVRMKRTAPAGR